jgi:glycosyltransferase involved in cell wall biosynthesis
VRPGVFDGGATYSLNVLRHLPDFLPDAKLVVYCREGETRIDPGANVEVRPVSIRTPLQRIVFETTVLSRVDADVFVSPNESLPLRLPCPAVVVAQNLAYHCDRGAASFQGGSAFERATSAMQTAYYRRRMPEAYRRAAVVVPISKTAADLLARKAGLPLAKTLVALGGSDSVLTVDPDPCERSRSLETLLIVSAVAPYKNFDAVVELLARLRQTRAAVRVEVAGPDWRGYRRVVEEHARRRSVADSLHFLGPVPPDELSRLYASATLLLHLSECEACPLPPLEAMRAGLPVVAADRSSIPEVVGEGGLLVDPRDSEKLVATIDALLSDPEALNTLRARGKVWAEELTWHRTASGIANAVRWAARSVQRV